MGPRSAWLGLLLLALARTALTDPRTPYDSPTDEADCLALADAFVARRHPPPPTQPPPPHDFIFFLHVPRTAGRSFFSCFLSRAVPATQRCSPSYDILRLDLSAPNCTMLASHDDMSVRDFLPEGARIVTQVRDPVDRVESAYEFAVEIAAREFRPSRRGVAPNEEKTNTRDVWPWSVLVPFFDRDLRERSIALEDDMKAKGIKRGQPPRWIYAVTENATYYYYNTGTRESKWNLSEEDKKTFLPNLDPFDNPLMMSLEDFVNSPLAEELLHNAMTLQLLGLTDNSYWPEAAEVRHCAKRHRSVQQRLVPVAKGVLSSVFHVSMTSRLDESLLSMAAMLGRDLRKPAFRGKPAYVEINSDGSVYWGQRSKDPRELTDAELAYWLVEAWDDWSASRRVNRYVGSKPTMRDENEEDIEEGLRETAAFKKRLKLLQTEFLLRRRQGMGQSLGTLHPMKYEGNTTVSAQGLWTTYENCVKGAQSKNKLRKVRAVAHLSTPDERVPMFTKPARAKIPQRILDTIRQKNLMDAELFEWGTQLFEKQLLDLEERGITMEGLRTSSKMAPPQESWLGSWFESKTAKFFMPSIIACVVFLGMVPLGVCVGMLRRVVGRDRDSWKSE